MSKKIKNAQSPNPKQLENVIRTIISEVGDIKKKKIGFETRFVEDLGMDSMMALEILAAIEKKYDIEIPEESLPKLKNLKEVLALTKKILSE